MIWHQFIVGINFFCFFHGINKIPGRIDRRTIDCHIIRIKVNSTYIDWDTQSEGNNTESTSDGDE